MRAPRETTAWRLFMVSLALVASCAASATPPAPEPTQAVASAPVSVAWLPPPPPPMASASASGAMVTPPAAIAAACTGAELDLSKVLAGKDCRVPADEQDIDPPTVRLRFEPEHPTVSSGEWVVVKVIIENTGSARTVVRLADAVSGFGNLWGDSSDDPAGVSLGIGGLGTIGTAKGDPKRKLAGRSPARPPPAPSPPPTPGMSVSATDDKGRTLAFPGGIFGILGALGNVTPEKALRIDLPPHGRAIGTVRWSSFGYIPGKTYTPKRPRNARPNEGAMLPPPEPLPPGDYVLEITTGASADAVKSGALKVTVTR